MIGLIIMLIIQWLVIVSGAILVGLMRKRETELIKESIQKGRCS